MDLGGLYQFHDLDDTSGAHNAERALCRNVFCREQKRHLDDLSNCRTDPRRSCLEPTLPFRYEKSDKVSFDAQAVLALSQSNSLHIAERIQSVTRQIVDWDSTMI